jgi:hypothetical protein
MNIYTFNLSCQIHINRNVICISLLLYSINTIYYASQLSCYYSVGFCVCALLLDAYLKLKEMYS